MFLKTNYALLDAAVRVSGKLLMVGEEDMYLQAYLVPAEGASYTAITRVPQRHGPSLQLLEPLASTLGWIIAKPLSGAVNGFQLTGKNQEKLNIKIVLPLLFCLFSA